MAASNSWYNLDLMVPANDTVFTFTEVKIVSSTNMRPKHFENIIEHHKNYLDQKIIDFEQVLQQLKNASNLSKEWLENPRHHLSYKELNELIEQAISSLCNEAMTITRSDNQCKEVTIVSQPTLQIDTTVNANSSTAVVLVDEKVKHAKDIIQCVMQVSLIPVFEASNSTEYLFDDESFSLLNEVSSVSSVSTFEFCRKEKIQVQECFLFKAKVRKFTENLKGFFSNVKVKRQWKKFT